MKYFNREFSWLSFNHRVLQEAADPSVPLFERIKFLAIFSSNLEEFFRVRVASIRSLLRLNQNAIAELEFNPKELLKGIYDEVNNLQNKFGIIFKTQIIPELNVHQIFLKNETELNEEQRIFVKEFFRERIQLYVNPMILIKKKVKPFLRTGVLYFAVAMTSKDSKSKKRKYSYGLVEIPSERLPRFIILPSEVNEINIIFLDDIIREFLGEIYDGYNIEEVCSVKLTRDAELYIDDEFSGDLLEKIKKSINKRNIGLPSRFLYDTSCSKKLTKFLRESLSLEKEDLIAGARYHNFSDFFNFPYPHIKELEYEKLFPVTNKILKSEKDFFEAISKQDFLLNFPYESFEHVIKFIDEASNDPGVKEIKITLYRVAKDSKIISGLLNALRNGKTVTIFSEIKARFDEEMNIEYAKELKSAGAVIIYSIPGLKVHAKLCLVIREEKAGVKKYCYLATGNFNEKTARFYSDFGFFTAEKDISDDVEKVFSILEGKKDEYEFSALLVAQYNMKKSFIKLIDNEIENAKNGINASIVIKLNSLEDKKMIEKLYEASNAGVDINIIVRGVCCLIPGIKNLSENIKVISIVDRFLEHSRVFIFHNGGDEKIFLSSADWMKRNLNRRIEAAFPVKQKNLKQKIKDIIQFQIDDNTKARIINKRQDNIYVKGDATIKIRSQMKTYEYLLSVNS